MELRKGLLCALVFIGLPALADSRPDFSGVWSNASLTSLTRPANIEQLVISPDDVDVLTSSHFHNVRAAADQERSDTDKKPPEKLDKLPPVGNYNAFWVDPGARYGVVNGEIRSSWLVHPADGQIPHNSHAQDVIARIRAGRELTTDPEQRSVGERCLLGFGSSGGPPMLNVLYNNFYRFVQTPDHLMMLVEMVHDARIARFDQDHRPSGAYTWLGDTIGRFEGDTLVLRTTNFHPERGRVAPLLLSPTAVVEERLKLITEGEMLYTFRIDDPVFYDDYMYAEMTMTRVDDLVYEYACHEGNYGLGGILRGARLLESEAASAQR